MRYPVLVWAAVLLTFQISFAAAQVAAGSIRLSVVLEDGSGVPGTLITATMPGEQPRTTVSNERGGGRFLSLPPGCWKVTFQLEGFQTVQREICVNENESATTTVVLQVTSDEEELVVTGRVGGSFSRIENNSRFGTGTSATAAGEGYGAFIREYIDRWGFELGLSVNTETGYIFGTEGHGRFIGTLSYAQGSLSGNGSQTVGVGGVTQVGLTFLQPDGVFGTGIGSAIIGDGLESQVNLDNSWTLGSFGYRESFYPNGPTGLKVSVGGEVTFENFRNDFSGEADIVRGGVSLADQITNAYSSDYFFGFSLSTGVSQAFLDRKLVLGAEAYVNPSYHSANAEISQFTNFGGGISQLLEYSDSGFALSGGLRVKARYKITDNTRLRFAYEYSILGDVTEVIIPSGPLQQPAQFSSGPVERHFVNFGISRKF